MCSPRNAPTPWHRTVYNIACTSTIFESLLFPVSCYLCYLFVQLLRHYPDWDGEESDEALGYALGNALGAIIYVWIIVWVAPNFAMCFTLWKLMCCGGGAPELRQNWAGLACTSTTGAIAFIMQCLATILALRHLHTDAVGAIGWLVLFVTGVAGVLRLLLSAYLCCNCCGRPADAGRAGRAHAEEAGIELPVATVASQNPAGRAATVPWASPHESSGGGAAAPPSWTCKECTYHHTIPIERTYLTCKLCGVTKGSAHRSNQEEEARVAVAARPPPQVPTTAPVYHPYTSNQAADDAEPAPSLQTATFLRCVHAWGVRYRNSPREDDIANESVTGQEIVEMSTHPPANDAEAAALDSGVWVRCASNGKWLPVELNGRPLFEPLGAAAAGAAVSTTDVTLM